MDGRLKGGHDDYGWDYAHSFGLFVGWPAAWRGFLSKSVAGGMHSE
jgi:hypothetical protein